MAGFDPDSAFEAAMRMRFGGPRASDIELENSHSSMDFGNGGGGAFGDFIGNPLSMDLEDEREEQAQPIADDVDYDDMPALGGASSSFFKLINKDAMENPHRQPVDDEVDLDGDDDGQAPAAKPKRSFGNRVKGFFKGAGRMAQGLWGLGKNLTGYNLLRHGLIGANFRRAKLNKNLAKWNSRGKTDAERFTAPDAWKLQRKIERNRLMLANHRHYYTGLRMANEFRRGAGKESIKATELPQFFHGR